MALREMLGQGIRRCRLAKGMNQSELARAAGISYAAISAWESGKRTPNAKNLSLITNALHVTELELLKPNDDYDVTLNGKSREVVTPEVMREIKRLRIQNEITQEELAEKIGVCWITLFRWENGKGTPEIALIPKFARELGVTPEELLYPEAHEEELVRKRARSSNRKEKIMT